MKKTYAELQGIVLRLAECLHCLIGNLHPSGSHSRATRGTVGHAVHKNLVGLSRGEEMEFIGRASTNGTLSVHEELRDVTSTGHEALHIQRPKSIFRLAKTLYLHTSRQDRFIVPFALNDKAVVLNTHLHCMREREHAFREMQDDFLAFFSLYSPSTRFPKGTFQRGKGMTA